MVRKLVVSFLFLAILGAFGACNAGELQRNYYRKSCRGVEQIVRDITWRNVSANPSLAPKLLRLHYHDCFVRV